MVNDHWNLGENEEAKKCDEKALMVRKKTHGEEHPDVARSYGNLGSDYTALQRYEDTEECFEKTLMVEKKQLCETNILTHNPQLLHADMR